MVQATRLTTLQARRRQRDILELKIISLALIMCIGLAIVL